MMIKFKTNSGLTIGGKPLHESAQPSIQLEIRDGFGHCICGILNCKISEDGNKITFDQIPKRLNIELFDDENVDKFKDKSIPKEITHIAKQARYFYSMAVVEKIIEDTPELKDNIYIE